MHQHSHDGRKAESTTRDNLDFKPYRPSDDVAREILKSVKHQDRLIVKARRTYARTLGIDLKKIDVAGRISDDIEDLMTSLAHEAAYNGKSQVVFLQNGRLVQKIIQDYLTQSWSLEESRAERALGLLFDEFIEFALAKPRQRHWGQIACEDGQIILKVDTSNLPHLSRHVDEDPFQDEWVKF